MSSLSTRLREFSDGVLLTTLFDIFDEFGRRYREDDQEGKNCRHQITVDIITQLFPSIPALFKHRDQLLEVARKALEHMENRNPKPRFEERDKEITRLRDTLDSHGKQRSFGRIVLDLKGRWPDLTRSAAIRAYNRLKKKNKR